MRVRIGREIHGVMRWLVLACLVGLWGTPAGAASDRETAPSGDERNREGAVAADGPRISYVDNPTGGCYRPQPESRDCFLNWDYFSVTASSSQYILDLTIEIDGRARAAMRGFFQTSMYLPQDFFGPGLRVACGQPGASGIAKMGQTHSIIVRASETGGLTATNYVSETCPFTFHIFADGFESGDKSAWSAHLP